MPRKTRIDRPGLLNHVIFRGIERKEIFRSAEDYKEFLSRLETVKGEAQIFVWALMLKHGNLLALPDPFLVGAL
jgi:putative transposase